MRFKNLFILILGVFLLGVTAKSFDSLKDEANWIAGSTTKLLVERMVLSNEKDELKLTIKTLIEGCKGKFEIFTGEEKKSFYVWYVFDNPQKNPMLASIFEFSIDAFGVRKIFLKIFKEEKIYYFSDSDSINFKNFLFYRHMRDTNAKLADNIFKIVSKKERRHSFCTLFKVGGKL